MKLVMDLSTLHSKFLKRIDAQLSIHGISFTEFLVMYRLSHAPHNMLRRVDLAESIGLSASGVTRLLIPMEKLKMVQREANPRDARVSLVSLSDPGKKLLNDALVSYEHSADTVTQALEKSEIEQLLKLIEKLLH